MQDKKIDIIGIGVGINTISNKSIEIIKNAQVLIGAKRMIEEISPLSLDCEQVILIDPQKIITYINENNKSSIVILMSGDTGFHSGTTKLISLFNDNDLNYEIHAGISSISYMASKIKRPWNDINLSSAHGVDCNFVGKVLSYKESVFLVGGEVTASSLIDTLLKLGFIGLTIHIGEDLGLSTEKITTLTPSDLMNFDNKMIFSTLSIVWVIRPNYFIDEYIGKLEDDDFIRGNVPITKSIIRNHIISSIGRNQEGLNLYDIGAGTGSVAIELALSNPMSMIYAFEGNKNAIELIKQNREKFNVYNLILIEVYVENKFIDCPAPDKVFIGGSKGNMTTLFDEILSLNDECYICISAITVETLNTAMNSFNKHFKREDIEINQIFVARSKLVASYNMLMGENPIFIISGGDKKNAK